MSDNMQQPPSAVAEGKRHLSPKQKVLVIGGMILGIGATAMYFSSHSPGTRKAQAAGNFNMNYDGSKFTPPPVSLSPASMPMPLPTSPVYSAGLGIPRPVDPNQRARESDLMGFNQAAQGRPNEHDTTRVGANRDDPDSPLAQSLRVTQLEGTRATRMRNPDYTVMQGTMIPCIQQTAINTSYPGPVTAVLPQDIRGATGRVVLLDKGTKLFGTVEHGIVNGLDRVFVVWHNATTPSFVRVTLDSPAADEVGQTGLDGVVDRHLWRKIGGVLMLSLVDGAIQAGVNAAQKSGTSQSTYAIGNGGENAASILLRNNLDIPDVLHRNQGLGCAAFLVRDLDFSSIYGLRIKTP